MKKDEFVFETKNFTVVDKSTGLHEYDIEVIKEGPHHTRYNLKASHNSEWTEHTRGVTFVSIFDHGNGIQVSFTVPYQIAEIGKKSKNDIGYDTADELRILLNFKNEYESYPSYFEVFENKLMYNI